MLALSLFALTLRPYEAWLDAIKCIFSDERTLALGGYASHNLGVIDVRFLFTNRRKRREKDWRYMQPLLQKAYNWLVGNTCPKHNIE